MTKNMAKAAWTQSKTSQKETPYKSLDLPWLTELCFIGSARQSRSLLQMQHLKHWDSNPGLLGAKRQHYLWAMPPTHPYTIFVGFKILRATEKWLSRTKRVLWTFIFFPTIWKKKKKKRRVGHSSAPRSESIWHLLTFAYDNNESLTWKSS